MANDGREGGGNVGGWWWRLVTGESGGKAEKAKFLRMQGINAREKMVGWGLDGASGVAQWWSMVL